MCPDFVYLSVSHFRPKGSLRVACGKCSFSEDYDSVLNRIAREFEEETAVDRALVPPPAKIMRMCEEIGRDREFVFAEKLRDALDGNVIYVQKKRGGYYWVFYEEETKSHKRGWKKDYGGMFVRESIKKLLSPCVDEEDC